MRKTFRNSVYGFATAAALFATPAHAETPNVCLGLLGDTSGSVGGRIGNAIQNMDYSRAWSSFLQGTMHEKPSSEYRHMIKGMASALRDKKVIAQIIANAPVAISYMEFTNLIHTRLEWKILKTEKDIATFADDLDHLSRIANGNTYTGEALNRMFNYIKNDCPGRTEETRKTIDIATDDNASNGAYNPATGRDPIMEGRRDFATQEGFTINALAMNTKKSGLITNYGYNNLLRYLQNNVVTPDGRVFDVRDPTNYAEAFVRKFSAEIAAPAMKPKVYGYNLQSSP